LATNQIAQTGLSSLPPVIYYSEQLFSNVRISQYQHIGEHHVLRWMRVPGYIEEGDPEIMVSLGSDDPGIFASNLETEFYLLYSTLRKAGLSDTDALHRLSILNERGRIYRFHHPMI
ncbi:hypothetical protein, partial [Aeromonas allosaccharophila]